MQKHSLYSGIQGCLHGLLALVGTAFLNTAVMGQVSVQATSGITTYLTGQMQLALNGDWDNQGMILPGMSTFRFEGQYMQNIGQVMGDYYNVNVDKVSGDVVLNSDIRIMQGTVAVWNGDVQLNGYQLVLDPEAELMEMPGNTVKGMSGAVQTERPLTLPNDTNIAGIGLGIESSEDLGVCILKRGHAPQASNGVEGISRYFDLTPATPGSASAVFHVYYDESELNGNTEEALQLYRSDDGGSNWIALEGTLDVASNSFQASDVPSVARYTLSSYCLETCVATAARAKFVDLYLNGSGLAVLLPGQVDDGSSGACGVDSMYVLPDAFDCSFIGSQQVALTVLDQNGCSMTKAVEIEVHDVVAPEMHCRDITLEVGPTCQAFLQPGNIDDGSFDACGLALSVDITQFTCDDLGENTVVLTGEDPSGNISQCVVTVTVVSLVPDLACNAVALQLGNDTEIEIDPLLVLDGDPATYAGYTFTAEPPILTCADLGVTEVTLLATDAQGNVLTCSSVVSLMGPDTDCDGVADQCDVCVGGDDQVDTDGDGTPDCADWDGYASLSPDWQCPNGNSDKVFICHNGNVICVNENAVGDHLAHGDFLGSCVAAECEPASAVVMAPGATTDQKGSNTLTPGEAALSGDIINGSVVVLEAVPNPYRSGTSIRFYLEKRSLVELSVFCLLGSRVGHWEGEVLAPGWHVRKFDASDVVPGVYMIRLRAGSEIAVIQIVGL